MRVVFRCDPALAERSAAPDPGAARVAGLAARHAGDCVLRSAWAGGAHRQTMSALRRRDVAWLRHSVAVRHPGARRRAVLGLGSSGAVGRRPSFFADQLPRSRAGRRARRSSIHGVVIVKFNSFWTIELEPGYSLFATHPVNRADLPFRLLTGLVDCDRFRDVGVLFPAAGSILNLKASCRAGRRSRNAFPSRARRWS